MERTTPAEAWEGFVGSQTVQEFVIHYCEEGYHSPIDCCDAYAAGLPQMFADWDAKQDLGDIACDLAEHIETTLKAAAHTLILGLAEEAGEDVSNKNGMVFWFGSNHPWLMILAAASGNTKALLELRRRCGLQVTA